MKVENVFLVLVVIFLLYLFMSNCGCRVEGFGKQYNFVYPKCSYAPRDHPGVECLSGKDRAIYYTTSPEAFSTFNGNTKVPMLTVHTDYKIPTQSPGHEDICLDVLTTAATRKSDDFHSKYGFKKGACDPRKELDSTTREKGDNSQTYGDVLHIGYADVSALGLGRSIPYTVNTKTEDKVPGSCNTNIVESCESIFPASYPYNNSLNITGNTVEENKKLCNNSIDSKGFNCYVPEGNDIVEPICRTQAAPCKLNPAECREKFCNNHGKCKEGQQGGKEEITCECDIDWSGKMCETRHCLPEGEMCDAFGSNKCCHGLRCHSAGPGAAGNCLPY